jgi:hypothetical protein
MLNEFKNIKNKIPKDYFIDFQSNLQKSVEDMDMIHLEEEAPLLGSIGKQTGFKVPEKYFENLSILQKAKGGTIKSLNIYRVSSIAASIILLALIGVFALNTNQADQKSQDLQLAEFEYISEEIEYDDSIFETIMADGDNYFEIELDETEIESLIENNISLFELSELEELL